MIDHTLIRTGFDYEILLGAAYFLTIVQGAYDHGEIPPEIEREDGPPIPVGRPHDAQVLPEDETADLMIFVMITYIVPVEVGLRFRVGFTTEAAQLTFVDLDEATKELIIGFAGEEALQEIVDNLQSQLDREVPLDLGAGFVQFVSKKLPGDGSRQAAIGLYANADLQIAPQSGPPEDEPIARGNPDIATSFLPTDRNFAIGLSLQTFQRMANHAWHQTGEEIDGDLKHPIFDPAELAEWEAAVEADPSTPKPDPIGKFVSFAITPLNGRIRMRVKSRIFIDFWPDADVTADFNLTPDIEGGNLGIETELDNYDVDTGLLGDLIAFLALGLFGVLILEVVEAVAEGATGEQVEREGQDRAAQAFSGLPSTYRLFSQRNDPFYETHVLLRHFYLEANVDPLGMSLEGEARVEEADEPVPVELVDKTRSEMFPAFENLMSLFYRVPDFLEGERIELLMADVIARLPVNRLTTVEMRPTAVHRTRTIIRDIRFAAGVDFTINESIFLLHSDVLTMPGYELIQPRRPGVYGYVARPYFRDRADSSREDNLDELPTFEPSG